MPAPYPAADLEGPIATSWMWPPEPPIKKLKEHRTHLLITMLRGAGNPIQRRLSLTAVTALAAKQIGVLAVYWPESTLVIYPPLFNDMAETFSSEDMLPIHLWVDLRVIRTGDATWTLFTTGLTAFGHMEIEAHNLPMEPEPLREWIINVIYYLFENGPVLQDGQTSGISAEQKIRIRHCESSFGHPHKIIRLDP